MATDEEVAAQKETVAKLRAKLDEAKSAGEQKRKELENDITMTNLVAEEARLQAELDQVNDANKVSTMRASVEAPLQSAEEQMKAAMAHQKAVADEIAARNKKKPANGDSADKGNEGA